MADDANQLAIEQEQTNPELAIEQEKTRRELAKIEAQARIRQEQEDRSLAASLEKQERQQEAALEKSQAQAEKQRLATVQRTAAARAKEESTARAITIPYSPPAGRVRMATGQVFPSTPKGWFNALAGVGIGVATATVIIGLMPANEKWAGAIVSGVMGAALGVVSPVASLPGDMGWGMLGPAVFYLYLNLTGQICSNQSTGAVREITPVIPIQPQPMVSPWEEYVV